MPVDRKGELQLAMRERVKMVNEQVQRGRASRADPAVEPQEPRVLEARKERRP